MKYQLTKAGTLEFGVCAKDSRFRLRRTLGPTFVEVEGVRRCTTEQAELLWAYFTFVIVFHLQMTQLLCGIPLL